MRLLETKLMQETGKAMSKANIVRVSKDEIPEIISFVSHVIGVPVDELRPLGTTGKTETSGDIDLVIDSKKYTPFLIHDRMMKQFGDEYGTYNDGTKIGSYAVHVGDGARVQVDLMFSDSPQWAEFAYFSAGDRSKYKGAIRTILLSAVAAALDEEGTDTFVYDGEDLVVRVGRGIDLGVGLKRLFQMRRKRKHGNGYLKSLDKVTPEDIKQSFPDLEFQGDDLIVSDPTEVVKVLFGPSTRPSNVDTAEEVLELIRRFPPAKQKKIFNIAKIRAQHLGSKGIELPKELQS